MNCPSIKVPLRLLRGVTRTITLAIKDGDGEPLDLSGVDLHVVVSRDGAYDRYEPEITLRGEDNNLVVFIWPADRQALGCYTIDIRGDFGDIGIGRTNWHGPDGIEIVEYANQATEREVADLTVEEVELEGTMETAAGNVIYYIKPADGIPASDMTQEVQDSLALADSAYQKPQTGIPATDLAQAVQTSLGKADSAYQKPVSGIPSSDMTEAVRTSLGKADTAMQEFIVTYNVTTMAEIKAAIEAGKLPVLVYVEEKTEWGETSTTKIPLTSYYDGSEAAGYPYYKVEFAETTYDGIRTFKCYYEDDFYVIENWSINTKTIPDAQVQSDWNQATSTAKDFIKNKPDLSQFITKSVNDLVNYYTKSETYTQTEVNSLIAAVKQFVYVLANSLPTASADTMGKIYLIPSADPQQRNTKDEYITIDNGQQAMDDRYTWEQIGSTAIDLSGYVTTTALNTALQAYTTTADLTTLLAGKQDVISDLSDIRSGAAAGATAYQKPQTGIPSTDLASGVQTSLGKADTAAQPTGTYPQMTVGNLSAPVTQNNTEFFYREAGGNIAVAAGNDGAAEVQCIKGQSIKLVQLFHIPDRTYTEDGVTIDWSSSGSVRIHGTYTGEGEAINFYGFPSSDINFTAGHKYLCKGWFSNDAVNFVYFYDANAITVQEDSVIQATNTCTVEAYIQIAVTVNQAIDFTLYPIFIDLTEAYGAGNEPSIEAFSAWPNQPFFGAIVNNMAEGIKTVGFNAWDGTFSSENVTSRIYCLPNTAYCLGGTNTTEAWNSIRFYDSTETEIPETAIEYGVTLYGYIPDYSIFTTPANCAYFIVYFNSDYNNFTIGDICINISDSTRNGQYEPYWESETRFSASKLTGKKNGQGNSVTIFPNGLTKLGPVYDELKKTSATRRVRVLDLGDFTFTNDGSGHYFYAYDESFPGWEDTDTVYCMCDKYDSTTFGIFYDNSESAEPVALCCSYAYCIRIFDPAYDNDTDFNASLSGIKFYYELVTPEQYILDDGWDDSYRVEDLGTEQIILPDDGNGNHYPSAKFSGDLSYALNGAGTLNRLNTNYVNRDDVVQGSGNDANKVISQAAMTRLLNEVAQSVSSATEQPASGMVPNVFYNFGELSEETSFVLDATPVACGVYHYYWVFSTGSTAPTVNWPTGITWASGAAPTVSANKHYEISVLNGIGVALEV